MKFIGTIAVSALLNGGLLRAGDYTGTNNMPKKVSNLMEAAGYSIDQKNFNVPRENTNSLRDLRFIDRRRFIPLEFPAKKARWSLWNNSSFKYAGKNTDPINVFAPYTVFNHYEYDITYSFDF